MWGSSPPLDLRREIRETHTGQKKVINFLILGAGDARHTVKTLSLLKKDPSAQINFHSFESAPEYIARSMLLLHICLQKNLGLQESARYFLEILGNTMTTPGTAKFLYKTLSQLIGVTTQELSCPWLDLEFLKYRDRDSIEAIMKFWMRAVCTGSPIIQYWDKRLRNALGTRYDYREGVFDWDYHMVLKSRNIRHLTLQDYRFWRNCGIAFTWLETDPSRSNPTLITNYIPHGNGYILCAYSGDITNGPYLTWAQDDPDGNSNSRATDEAEMRIMKAIHEIREGKEFLDDSAAAHRDQSLSKGTLLSEMPDIDSRNESWMSIRHLAESDDPSPWILLENAKVIFHSVSHLQRYKNKLQWQEVYDVAFVAHYMIDYLIDIIPLMKKGTIVIVESKKFLIDVRKEQQDQYANELLTIASENGLEQLEPFNPHEDDFCRLIKINNELAS